MKTKEKKSIGKVGFLISIIGSAVGLGGIWGFPKQMYQYKGTFLIPFIICMLICAIPVLFLEMTISNKSKKNHVEFFTEKAGKKGAFFAWLHSSTVIMLGTYYSVLIGWTIINILTSFSNLGTGADTDFYTKILGLNTTEKIDDIKGNVTDFSGLGSINWQVLLAMLFVWLLVFVILARGVVKGIDKANKVFIPGLFLLIIILVIYTSTLDGAGKGIDRMFSFTASDLLTPNIWKAAFGQAFFMLSTCTGTIYVYAAHAPKNQDNTNHAFIVGFGTTIIGVLTTIIIFNAIAAIAFVQAPIMKKPHIEMMEQLLENNKGPALIFRVLPRLFSILNSSAAYGLGNLISLLFFVSLFFAGISSLIGQIESMLSGLEYQVKMNRTKALIYICLFEIFISIIFVLNKSLVLFDPVGDWIATQWLLVMGLWLLISMTRFGWNLYPELKAYNDKVSWIKWNKFLTVIIIIVAPLIIFINIIAGFYTIGEDILKYKFIHGVIGLSLGVVIPLSVTLLLTYYEEIQAFLKNLYTKKQPQVI